MPIVTPLTELLGIRHPILLAPMDTIAGSRLTRAVSEAGGFGILGGGYGDRARLQAEAAELKGFAPFGIGFITGAWQNNPSLSTSRSMRARRPSCCHSAIPRRSRRASRQAERD